MNKEELQKGIFELLAKSKITDHNKRMITLLLPAMQEKELNGIYDALMEEANKLNSLAEKKKRIELKYQVMVQKVNGSNKKSK